MDIIVLYLFTAWFFCSLLGDWSVGCFYTCKVSGGIQRCVSDSFAFAFLSWMLKISSPLLFLHHLAVYRLQKILYSYDPTPLGEGDGYRDVYHVWYKSAWEGSAPKPLHCSRLNCLLVFSSFQAHCEDSVVSPCRTSMERSIGNFDYDFCSQSACPTFKGTPLHFTSLHSHQEM